MANFEFITQNNLNTTTMVTVANGTSTVDSLFNRDSASQYSSSGRNNDTVGHTITVEFPSSKPLSRICIQNTNLKSFKIYHSSNAANTLTLTSTCDTTTSHWTGNSATSLYLMFSTVACTSIVIDATVTIDANEEKKIGQLWCCDKKYTFERNPDAKSYKPKDDRTEFLHTAAGGGVITYTIDEYYTAQITLNYWPASETSALYTIYKSHSPFVFVPFPTGTSWDNFKYEIIKEVVWIKDFDLLQPAANNFSDVGFKGKINLSETPR